MTTTLDTSALTLEPSYHALKTILAKGFDAADVRATFEHPRKVTRCTARPGQIRLLGNGLALVGEIVGGTFVLVTVYEDGVLTPPRPDQLCTPEGRRYAKRYAAGLGRG